MEIKQLRALRLIVETGSFSAAAQRLRLTQSALSHQIKNLEAELGETLRVAGTSFGMVYLYGELCEAFMARYPGIDVAFRATETPEEAARRVEEGDADVAFIPFLAEHPLLEVVPLGVTEDVFIVGRGHALARRKTVTLDEIRRH